MDEHEAIKKELLQALKEFLPKGPKPTEEMHLIKDLHLDGDDASELILLVQKRLGIS